MLTILGLFTAHGHEPNWAIAHRILIPSFGPLSIRSMFDDMFDVASQLVVKVGVLSVSSSELELIEQVAPIRRHSSRCV